MPSRWPIAGVVASLLACGAAEDQAIDASTAPDGSSDSSDDASGASLFTVSGDCDVLDTELTDDQPATFDGAAVFDHEFTDDDEPLLSAGGMKILRDGNAGGSSLYSELFAFEILDACESLTLLKTENEIEYAPGSKKTDFLAEIDGEKIGVSVTRAQTFPLGSELTIEAAEALLDGKLADILNSTANVVASDRWQKQILAVMVYNREHLASLEAALPAISPATRADTVLWMTVTDGPDLFIYE